MKRAFQDWEVTCEGCGTEHALARTIFETGEHALVCHGCEQTVYFDVPDDSEAVPLGAVMPPAFAGILS